MAKSPFDSNTLYYGDNLEVLRKYFPNECVDLVYLDPPFNSKADYNILFKEASGEESAAQIQAFTDFWTSMFRQATKSAMGILITLYEPTEQMKQAAMEAEYYESPTWGHKYPKIQILTIPELLEGSKPILPHTH